ncbi:MAG: TetR/AcrR family transcriptional regulator [Pseudomonadota bacterium]
MKQHDRRLEVSNAAWRVIVREGLDRATMRAIARELDCTTGVVTHYFHSKEELILFALHQVTERLQRIMGTLTAQTEGAARLVAMLTAFLPVDREREEILRVWVAFLGYAVGREALMGEHQHSAGSLRQAIIQELEALQQTHVVRADIVPSSTANVLLALANGVALDTLLQAQSLSVKQQREAIEEQVQALLA